MALEDGLRRTLAVVEHRQWVTPMDEREFDERVAARSLVVGVVGLGYVGLPLAVAHAESGFTVVGFDVDAERTDALNTGRSHVEDIADARLAAQVSAGRFAASADRSRARPRRCRVHLRADAVRSPPDA